PGRDSTTSTCPVLSVTFLPTMRCSVSALAPGVYGMMMVIGRADNSSAAACEPTARLTTSSKSADKAPDAFDISTFPGGSLRRQIGLTRDTLPFRAIVPDELRKPGRRMARRRVAQLAKSRDHIRTQR